MRILAAEVSEQTTTSVGVVSWVLLRDGWHSLTPRHDDDGARSRSPASTPTTWPPSSRPVLAQVDDTS